MEATMPNFIITYDLNGPRPTHKEMDDHLNALGPAYVRGRLLETVWYLTGPGDFAQVREYVRRILGKEDLLLVIEAKNIAWTKLLVDEAQFKTTFEANAMAA